MQNYELISFYQFGKSDFFVIEFDHDTSYTKMLHIRV